MTILVTGGAGFIGSSFIKYVIENTAYKIINLDKLTYAGNLENLGDIPEKYSNRYRFVHADICDSNAVGAIFENSNIDWVVNFAAETHVDRAIEDSDPFLQTNVAGTGVLLKNALKAWENNFANHRFLQISTDEVYGAIKDGDEISQFLENTPLSPHNPYSASKAAADMLAMSYANTYGLPVLITRCSNNFGPNQYPEKLIPVVIKKAVANESIPIYGDGMNVRDWIFVEEHSRAVLAVLEEGRIGEVYNIGARNRLHNIDLVKMILDYLGKPDSLVTFVTDRLGHDRIYRINNEKIITETSWKPKGDFMNQLTYTIDSYIGDSF
jgi:dTDP-glucose 4,6-dehydratase